MYSKDIQARIQGELQAARDGRQNGNEGRARVCARRAAGVAARIFLGWKDGAPALGGIPDLFIRLAEIPSLSDSSRLAARNLLMTVDSNHALPEQIDLIHEAELLIAELEHQMGSQTHSGESNG
jgi:hypothetical protein